MVAKAEPGGEGVGGEKEGSGDVQHLQEKVRVLTEEKRAMETQLEAFRQAGKDEREKAEILAAEKKYRTQVCFLGVGRRRIEFVKSIFVFGSVF